MVNIPLESGYGLPAAYVAGLRASPDLRYAHFVPSPTSPDRMSLMGTVLPGYGQPSCHVLRKLTTCSLMPPLKVSRQLPSKFSVRASSAFIGPPHQCEAEIPSTAPC
ncbi:hypothetical protein EAF00_005554 [Botryotinia globosa]|nr:hypothetical protein EAF00_005554 [Botryotinia globosa]